MPSATSYSARSRRKQMCGLMRVLRGFTAALTVLCASFVPKKVAAQTTVYWDTNGNTTGAGTGSTATGTWSQNSGNMWSTSANGGTTGTWQTRSGGSGIATFAAGTNATGSYTVTVSGTITGIRGITFQDTISGNTLTLSGGILTLGASSSINVTNAGAKGLITSVLTDGASTFGITKTGAGTLALTGANTYSGATTLSAGILEANTLADGGVASSIGDSSNGAANLIFSGGTLRYVGSGASTNRQFTLNSPGGTIDSSGTGALVFTNQGGLSGSGNRTLTLSGSNTGDNTFGLLLQNNAGTTSLTKSGNGTWLMTNQNNSYTGPTTISGGVLSVGTLNNIGSSSSIGSGVATSTATNAASLVLNGGTLRYTGGAVSTNRLFTIGTSGGTIDASGSGALTFSNTGAIVASGTGNRTLTLTGSNTDNNTFASIIANPTTGTTSLQKTGSGTWVLTGANTYTGTTSIGTANGADGGTLVLGNNNVLPGGAVNVYAGTLDYNTRTDTIGALNLGGGASGTTANVTGTSGTLTLGGTVTYNATNNPNGATISGNLALGGNRIFTINDSSAAAADLTVSANISGANTLTKGGNGTLVLSGNNSYTGLTTISAGALNVQSATGLGTTVAGTTVSTGASLELQGGIAVGAEALTLNGTGLSSNGALRNVSGTNSFAGTISLATDSEIQSDAGTLTLSNTIARSGATNRALVIDGAGNVAITGAIANTITTLTKTGSGTLTLSNTGNAYTGATNIGTSNGASGGTLVLGNSNVLPGTTVNIFAGTLDYNTRTETIGALNLGGGASGTTAAVTGSTGTLTLGGNVTYTATNNPNGATISGNLALGGNRTFNIGDSSAATNDLTVSAVISGANSLTKTGTGTLLLSGANTYTGATNVGTSGGTNAGSLVLGANNVLPGGTLNVYAGTLDYNTRTDTIGALNLGGGASGTTAAVTGSTGTLTLGGNVTYTATNNPNGATISGNLALGGNRTFNIGDSTAATNDLTVSAVISGANSITKTGAGTLLLSGANTYTGTTSIGTSGGTSGGSLVLGANNVLPGNTVNVYAGTLDFNSRTDTIGALNLGGGASGTTAAITGTSGTLTLGGNVTYSATNNPNGATISGNLGLGAATRTFNIGNSTAATNDLSVSANITGSGGILKTGTGTLALSGANNTFSGGVTVNDGVLLGTGTTNIGGFAAFGDYSSVVVPTTVITVNNGGTLAVNSSYNGGDGSFATTQLLNIELNGAGYSGLGALRATGGTNTWNGNVSLGSNATITNAAVTGDSNILYLGPWNGAAPTFLTLNNNTVTFNGTGDVYVNSAIGASSGDTGKVVIDAASSNAIVYFGGPRNYFTGDTEIKNGILESQVNPGNNPNTAILGNLVIGDGTGSAGTAVMRQYFNHQISDTSTVTIHSDGKLDLSLYGGKTEVIQKLVLNGGQVDSTNGLLVLAGMVSGNDVEVTADSTFAGNFDLNNVGGGNPARTINVSAGATFTLNANLFGKDFIKNGDGTMVMGANNNANGYTGRTRIEGGVLRLTNSGALGGTGGGSEAAGTSVSSGATLQLSGGTLSVPAESLTLNGAGYNSLGALNNASGNNSWAGAIKLGSDSTIKTDAGSLTITGSITGTAATSATQTLKVGGAANTTISGPIYDGSSGGKLDVTKVDSGTLTLNGLNTFTGAVNVQAGTVAVTAHNVLGAHTNAVAVSSGATFRVSGGGSTISNTIGGLTGSGLVSIVAATDTLKINHSAANTFDGRLSGSGLFEKSGSGTFTFSSTANTSAFDFDGTVQLTSGTLEFQGGGNVAGTALSIGTLNLTGGTLLLTDAFINVGTLNITGDTILDFGTVGSSILNATNIYITAGKTLLIKNWTSEVDFLFATGEFRQNNSGGTIALWNAIGAQPENQVHFEGDPLSPDGSHTTWTNYDYNGYENLQIRPIPEPSTYGLCFLAGCVAFVGWRRYRKNRR